MPYKNLTEYEMVEIEDVENVYYFGQNCRKKKSRIQDLTKKDGSYNWTKGDHIYYRYEFINILGEGSFGQVFHCFDHKTNKEVAVKIVKNK